MNRRDALRSLLGMPVGLVGAALGLPALKGIEGTPEQAEYCDCPECEVDPGFWFKPTSDRVCEIDYWIADVGEEYHFEGDLVWLGKNGSPWTPESRPSPPKPR